MINVIDYAVYAKYKRKIQWHNIKGKKDLR